MSIQLEPSSQLGFHRPLTHMVKKSLLVRNNNSQPVAFKVKTTAPKLYCVRPNSGRVEPGQTVEVSVLLQPMKEEPPVSAKCKDKFLVQSTFIAPDRDDMPLQDLWPAAEQDGRVHQQKIKVVYLPPEGEMIEEADEGDQSQFTEGYSAYDTVRAVPSSTNGHSNVLDTFVPIHRTAPQFPHPQGHERSPSPAQGEYIIAHEDTSQQETHYGERPTTPGVVNINVHSAADEAAKYAEAQAEIGRLKALVANLSSVNQGPSMRRRTRAMTDEGSEGEEESVRDDETGVTSASAMTAESGVPLQVVIIIALGVFVTTYLFF